MWQPEPGWQRLPGAGPATVGVWSATRLGVDVVVKRLRRPEPQDAPGVLVPGDVNYWRRAADVALSGVVSDAPGLREAPVVRVDEDDEGITLVHERVEAVDPPGLWLAACLGRFAAVDLGDHPWLARDQLRSRLRLVERRGGWRTLARTPVAGPLRRPPAGGPARRPVRRQHPRPTRGRRRRHRLGAPRAGSGRCRPRLPVAGDPGGRRAPRGGVRRRAPRRPSDARGGRDGCARDGRLHRPDPARLGARPGRGG